MLFFGSVFRDVFVNEPDLIPLDLGFGCLFFYFAYSVLSKLENQEDPLKGIPLDYRPFARQLQMQSAQWETLSETLREATFRELQHEYVALERIDATKFRAGAIPEQRQEIKDQLHRQMVKLYLV